MNQPNEDLTTDRTEDTEKTEIARLRRIVQEQEEELSNLSSRLARVEGALRTDAGFAARLTEPLPRSLVRR
jgi:hypothetical protein